MPRPPPALAAVLASALLAGCPGGSDSSGPPPPTTFAASGIISAAAGQVIDSDTNDTRDVPKVQNDSLATAQAVPGSATIGGWVAEPADPIDAFRTQLGAGQSAVLEIADAGADLDLCLYRVIDPGSPVACSEDPVAPQETVTAPEAGEYFVVVEAVTLASNYVLTLGVNAAGLTASAGAAPGATPRGEFVPGEVLVRFRDGALGPARAAPGDELRARARSLGMEPLGGAVRGRPALLGLGATPEARRRALATLGVDPPLPWSFGAPLDALEAARRDTLRAVKALRARPDVASADPNFVFQPSLVPTNQYYPLQWHYPLINLPQAWDLETGVASVVVAVIDTGVVLDHPDFAGRAQLVPGYDFISDAARANDGDGLDANPDDPGDEASLGSSSWHGTHVTGTVVAAWKDGQGAAGVAPGARVMPLRALGIGGGTSADIIEAIRFAAGLSNASGTPPTTKAAVVNLSLGCLDCFSATEQAVYQDIRNAGVIVVAAAGNENSTLLGYPASYDGVVSVSAVDLTLARAPYSNHNASVDVAAPGGNTGANLNGDAYPDGVLSAVVDGTRSADWAFYQGTSMASPHVAGVVALMKSVCDTLSPEQLDAILAAGGMTRDIGAAGRDDAFGYGLVDALEAVQSANAQCGVPPPAGVEATPLRLDFGSTETTLSLTVTQTGAATPLTITQATLPAGAWLAATPAAGNANGFGAYTVTVNRTGLADGRYSGVVRFTRSDDPDAVVDVPVLMQVGAPTGVGDAGYLYVLLLDAQFEPLAQLEPGNGPGGGHYPYSFTGVPAGSYFIVAGTDSDNDDAICDEGEVCGMWPTLGVPTRIELEADRPGLDFGVGLDVGLGGAAPSMSGARGFKRLPAAKTIGGRP